MMENSRHCLRNSDLHEGLPDSLFQRELPLMKKEILADFSSTTKEARASSRSQEHVKLINECSIKSNPSMLHLRPGGLPGPTRYKTIVRFRSKFLGRILTDGSLGELV